MLGAVFGGQLGGPMEALAGLIGEQLGVERVPLEFSSEDGRHSLEVGGAGTVAIQDVVPFGVETGEPVRLAGVFHPAANVLTIGKATEGSRLDAFGISLETGGKAGFSSSFSWSG
jgi:hypothetical protein